MRAARVARTVCCLSALLCFASVAWAQETEPDETTNGGQNGAAATSNEQSAIYIPYDRLGEVFEDLNSTVVLPYAEYLKLWRAGQPHATDGGKVDAVITRSAYTVTIDEDVARIQAELTVNVLGKPWVEVPVRFGDAAVGELTVEGEDLEESDVLLRGTGDGAYALLFGKAGQHTVTIELVSRVRTSPDGREFAFETPPVGITTLELTIPEADQTVQITPQIVSLPVDEAANETRVKAGVGATGKISAQWHPRSSAKPEMELLTSVNNRLLVSVEDGLVHTDAYLHFDVLRGSLSQVQVVVPKDHRILDVSADARIKGWRTDEEENRQLVTIELLSESEKDVAVELHTEGKQAEDAFTVAGIGPDGTVYGIHAVGAVRESGQLVVRHSADLELTVVEQQGIMRIEQAQVDERIRGGGLAFKYYNPGFVLRAMVRPVEPRLVVTQATRLVFHDDELRLSAQLNYTVERAGLFELSLLLPENLQVDRVESPAMQDYSIDDESRVLTVLLSSKTQGAIQLLVTGHLDYTAGSADELTLPLLEPQNVERETGTILVFAPPAIEVISDESEVVSAQPMPAPAGQRVGEAVLTSAWNYTRRPVTIPVRTVRKPTRLTAEVGTVIDVKPESTEVVTHVDFIVEYAGVDTFRFMVPEAISDRLQIESVSSDAAAPAIKQKSAADAVDGWVTWTVVMQRDVLGRQRFELRYDLRQATSDNGAEAGDAADDDADAAADDAADADDAAADADADADDAASDDDADDAGTEPADEIEITIVRPLGLEESNNRDAVPLTRARGEILVRKDRSLSVSAVADGSGIEPIDIRELTLISDSGTQAFKYFRQGDDDIVTATLTRQKFEIEEVVATVVRRALVEIVLGEDATATYRCRFRLKTSERQRLEVALPLGMELLGAFVDDREVRLEKTGAQAEVDRERYWIDVARTASSDEEFTLTFQFLWGVSDPPFQSTYGRGGLHLPLPEIGGRETSVAVQQLRVLVWVPETFALVGEPDHFRLDREPRLFSLFMGAPAGSPKVDPDTWIGGETGVPLSLPTDGRVQYSYHSLGSRPAIDVTWWSRARMAGTLSVGLALIGIILLATSWANKLSFLLLLGLAAALMGLWDSHMLAHGLAAARYGLAFVLALWLIHALFGARRATAAAAATPTPPAGTSTTQAAVIPPPGVFEKGTDETSSGEKSSPPPDKDNDS
ncbi:hypothetical protein Mal4_24940 [Maioricimonas rarisocia]|uniref:Uncharacterized protein n=1 Tax=Maioricimonas rarisocia TaxID=2528026 RepID=A0A517Z6W9_9PLAN|nr:hypothetical protein [Maioricimonas rarisocia]QDU38171.1 hypothetical protein Mal4_24940 [Maioricimonas rarisocia]